MATNYKHLFVVERKPVTISNDEAGHRGRRVVGCRTLLPLHVIEGMFAQERRGARKFTKERKRDLFLDLVELRNPAIKLDKPAKCNYVTLVGRDRLNPVEMSAICSLLNWAANDRGCLVSVIEDCVNRRFGLSSFTQLSPEKYDEAVEFLIEIHSHFGKK